MRKRTTVNDVAIAAGVSRSTVSRVLRGESRHIRQATRERVLQATAALEYRPNRLAQGLRTQRSGLIGVITDNIESPFAPPLVAGIQECLTEAGLIPLVVAASTDLDERASTVNTFLSQQVDGIIFAMTWVRTVDLHLTEGLPIALAYSSSPSYTIPSALPDDHGGVVLGMQHLHELGHQRIAFVNGPEDWVSARQRIESYRFTLRRLGLPMRPDWIGHGEWEDPDSGHHAALRILNSGPERPTAFFVANDIMAVGVLDAVASIGLTVPEDVSVLGFDDRDLCTYVRPQLSTIALPLREIGRQAARGLLESTAGTGRHWPITVPCTLVRRASTGPAPV